MLRQTAENYVTLAVSKKTDTKWNSSTFYGTVPLFMEQFHNLWNNVPKNVEQVL